MILISSTLIIFFYIIFIVDNLWSKIYLFTPDWGDSKTLIYILLTLYIVGNIYFFNKMNTPLSYVYMYLFTVFSIGYVYTLYNIKFKETFIFALLLLIYQILVTYTFQKYKLNVLLITLITYLFIWSNQLKLNLK